MDLSKPKRVDFVWQECTAAMIGDCLARGDVAVIGGLELVDERHVPWADGFYKTDEQPSTVTEHLGFTAFMSPSVEGAWMPIPPSVIAISVGASALQPVEWVFVSAASLWRALKQRFHEAELVPFLDGVAIGSRAGGVQVYHPGYQCWQSKQGRRISCRFSGRLDHDVRPHPMAQPVFDFCREFVLDDRNQLCLSLDPGQTAMIANSLFCSARRAGQTPNETIVWLMQTSPNEGLYGFLEDMLNDSM